ncbi:hypothetical protein BpHYR1_025502 [Brachionus plicatilis]|uniref:Uncharacterized protein n=1 Tax=Brachionus plicatilis TaxID=10195 RepID=A0A3M7PEI3_BRAPC|nr:hypothetical protein BpHYR1_025502 [Brachionus plicatilis]
MILYQREKNKYNLFKLNLKNTWQISIPSDDIDNVWILLDDIDFENIDIQLSRWLQINFVPVINLHVNLTNGLDLVQNCQVKPEIRTYKSVNEIGGGQTVQVTLFVVTLSFSHPDLGPATSLSRSFFFQNKYLINFFSCVYLSSHTVCRYPLIFSSGLGTGNGMIAKKIGNIRIKNK